MEDRIVYRVGAAGATSGGVLAIVVNVFRAEHGTAIHQFAMISVVVLSLLILLGLVALTRSMDDSPAASAWAGFGWAFGLLGVTFSVASHVIYAALDRDHDLMGVDVLDGVELIADSLLFAWTISFFGATALFYGLAMASSSRYPSWLGWVTVGSGMVGFVSGFGHAFAGATSTSQLMFAISAGIFSLVIIYVGVLLLRRSSATAPIGANVA